jgi:cyanate permease
VLEPLATSGVLAAAVGWALAAMVLPWVVRGRSPTADAVGIALWALGLVAAGSSAAALAAPALPHAHVHGGLAGPVAGAALALALRAWRGPEPVRLRLPDGAHPAADGVRF